MINYVYLSLVISRFVLLVMTVLETEHLTKLPYYRGKASIFDLLSDLIFFVKNLKARRAKGYIEIIFRHDFVQV